MSLGPSSVCPPLCLCFCVSLPSSVSLPVSPLSPCLCLSHSVPPPGEKTGPQGVPHALLHVFPSHSLLPCVPLGLTLHHKCSPTLSHPPPQCHPVTHASSQHTASHSQPRAQRPAAPPHPWSELHTQSPTVPQSRGLSKRHTPTHRPSQSLGARHILTSDICQVYFLRASNAQAVSHGVTQHVKMCECVTHTLTCDKNFRPTPSLSLTLSQCLMQ